jgi:competence protein ComEC
MQNAISDSAATKDAHVQSGRWLTREWRRLGLWLPVAFGAGVVWFFSLPQPTPPDNWLVASVSFLLAAIIGWRGWQGWQFRPLFLACWLLGAAGAAFSFGATIAAHRLPQIHTPVLKETLPDTTLSGVVEDILVGPDSVKILLGTLRIDTLAPEKKPKKLRITTRRYQMEAVPEGSKKRQVNFHVGDRVILRATLFPPPPPASPGQFDFGRHFYFKEIGGVGFSYDRIIVLKKAAAAEGWEGALARFRLELSERVRQQIGGQGKWAEGAIANALMSGQQSAIPTDVNDAMRVSGLTHVLSISGLHLSLAAGIVFLSLRMGLLLVLPARWRDQGAKKIAAIAALVSSAAYLAVAGFPIAAQRSYVMVAIMLLAVLFDRQAMGMRSIAVAAVALLLWQPEAVLSSSFKLSFAATLAIIAWAEAGAGLIMRWRGNEMVPLWLRVVLLYFIGAMMTSFVASTITAPLIMADFQQFNSYGVIANMLLSPLVSFWIMPLVVISFLTLPFGLEGLPLQGLAWGISQMIALAEWVAGWPYASITTPTLTTAGTALVVAGGLWLMLWRTGWVRVFGLPAMLLGIWLAYQAPLPQMLLNRDGSQIATQQNDGTWRMLRGGTRNLNAKQWLEAVNQQEYARVPKDQDTICSAVGCAWQVADAQVLLRFDPKPLREYTPRVRIPDSELSPEKLKKRRESQAKMRAKYAQKNASARAEQAHLIQQMDAQVKTLRPEDVLIDLRANAQPQKQTHYIDKAAMRASGGMAFYQNDAGGWLVKTVADQQGRWPWAITMQ